MITFEEGARERIFKTALEISGIAAEPAIGDSLYWTAAHTACGICSRSDIPRGMEQGVAVILSELLTEGISRPVSTVKRGDTAITYLKGELSAYRSMLAPYIRLKSV